MVLLGVKKRKPHIYIYVSMGTRTREKISSSMWEGWMVFIKIVQKAVGSLSAAHVFPLQ